jgi:nicotinamide-nucleotide amidase
MTTLAAICIGDELLDGRVSDKNATHLAGVANRLDWQLDEVRIVADERDAIIDTLSDLQADHDVIVVSGGLGPTADDKTRQAAADWADTGLEVDEETLETLQARFDRLGYTFTDNNRAQCEFPAAADILPTTVGTAGGFRLRCDGTEAYFFPGVPDEFEWFVAEHLVSNLQNASDATHDSREFTFIGIGESQLETRVEQLVADTADRNPAVLREDLKLGFRADAPTNHLHVSSASSEALGIITEVIRDELARFLVSEQGTTPHARLGELLVDRDETVAVAESCTAGGLGARLTETPGSSEWFEYGFITYANRAKVDLLGVSEATLETDGAVSEACVREMARGARDRSDATYALAISGIAGPGGGTDDKPVGTVHFGLATPGGTYHRRIDFPPRSRASVRKSSVDMAVAMVIWLLDDHLMAHGVDGPAQPDASSSSHTRSL